MWLQSNVEINYFFYLQKVNTQTKPFTIPNHTTKFNMVNMIQKCQGEQHHPFVYAIMLTPTKKSSCDSWNSRPRSYII